MSKRLEFLCGLQAVLWGIWIFNPWWDSFPASTAYRFMAQLAPEALWGLIVLALGLAQWLAALTGRLLPIRRAIAVSAIFVWVTITLSFAFGNVRSTAMPNSAIAAIFNILAFAEINADILVGRK